MRHRHALFLSLLALLALTRWGHFGSAVSLPDASLAVFLLGGLWLGCARAWGLGHFAALMASAFAIDVLLARTATEAGWCLTPAYWGLVPTYALMWLAGRWLAHAAQPGVLAFATVGAVATTAAFVISNLTYWAYSGHFEAMPLAEYAGRVVQYYPPYLGSTALYLALGWVVHRLGLAQRPAALNG